MKVRAIPQRYLAYVEGAIDRALREIERGDVPDFMDDAYLGGTALLTIHVIEAPRCGVGSQAIALPEMAVIP